MSDLEIFRANPDVALQIPVFPYTSEAKVEVIKAALGLQAEISRLDSAILSSPDDEDRMPNQPTYWAGDTAITITELGGANSVMYEVELTPDYMETSGRPRHYEFGLTLEFVNEGVKFHRDNPNYVRVHETSNETDPPTRIQHQGLRAQEIILKRATRQLREKRLSASIPNTN